MVEPKPDNPSDPYARRDQTFPVLTNEQIERMKPFGEVQKLPKGEVVSNAGTAPSTFLSS